MAWLIKAVKRLPCEIDKVAAVIQEGALWDNFWIQPDGSEIDIAKDGFVTHDDWAANFLNTSHSENFDPLAALLHEGWIRAVVTNTYIYTQVADLSNPPYNLLDDLIAKHWTPDMTTVLVEDEAAHQKTTDNPLVGMEKALKQRRPVIGEDEQ